MKTPKGTLTTCLADDLAAGDTIVDTVVATAADGGTSDEVGGYVVELGKSRQPLQHRRARWSLPDKIETGALFLRVFDATGAEVGHARIPCLAHAPPLPRGCEHLSESGR